MRPGRQRADGGTTVLRGLRLRVTLVIVLLLGAIVVAGERTSKVALRGAYEDAARQVTLAIARNAVEELDDPEELDEELDELLDLHPGLHAITVYAERGGRTVRLASTDRIEPDAQIEGTDAEVLTTGRAVYEQERMDGEHVAELVYPMPSENLGTPTAVALYYRLAPLHAAQQRRVRSLVVLMVPLAAAMTVGLPLFLGALVFRPLDRLRDGMRRLRGGELGARLRWNRSDEIGALARDFDAMAEDLERSSSALAHQALHDPLTGLANRALLSDRVARALRPGRRRAGPVALLLVDLDDFKLVNDSLGHAGGDVVLVKTAHRLRACVRDGDTVARLGGDEFALLLEDLTDEAEALAVAERVGQALGQPYRVDGGDVRVGGSVGVAVAQDHDAEELLHNADLAMYAAKQGAASRILMFEPAMHEARAERLELERQLRLALEHDELVVHYQPLFDLESGGMAGVEALVRWAHPDRGLLLPGAFLTVAEESGLLIPMGWAVLDAACRQAAAWHRSHPELGLPFVSVNLSPRQLTSPELGDRVRGCLAETGLPPEALVLEISESALLDDLQAGVRALEELKGLGVRLAIDDFGTGYASLSYLRSFAFDMLKIDRSFVAGITGPRDQAVLAEALITLAGTLGLSTVAEGIEHPDQAAALRACGCELGQGFALGRPVDAEVLGRLLDDERARSSRAERLTTPTM